MSKLLLALPIFCIFVQLTHAQKSFTLPVVLPPFSVKDSGVTPTSVKGLGSCLLYLEGLGIMVFQGKDSSPNAYGAIIDSKSQKNKFAWEDAKVDCKNMNMEPRKDKDDVRKFTFTVSITPGEDIKAKQGDKELFTIPSGKEISLALRFQTVIGYGWQLYEVEALSPIAVTGSWAVSIGKGQKADNGSVAAVGIGSYNGYNFACGTTKAVRFVTDAGKQEAKLGIFFYNLQVQPFGYIVDKDQVHFSRNTTDCVGTFTHGSFMGIIVALVLATVLLFGFIMLNSVQTIDRFDDPKQKQLVINAKE